LEAVGDPAAVIFLPVDQPYLEGRHLGRLLDAWEGGAAIAVSAAEGRRGAPVLFTRDYFPELRRLEGDEGGRQVLRRYPDTLVEVEALDPRVLRDVDTLDDLERLERMVTAS
jgi:molybdenum cofactor cytidylyltransferase